MSSRSERVIKQMLCALPCTAPQVPMALAAPKGCAITTRAGAACCSSKTATSNVAAGYPHE
ncbi:hypothetical protein [Pseudomonas sp. SBB6]|uniref:hypothetical protein n=1 Tax=Pseudomonas sp. SBB6 TaxID=2962032 RepID=UPI0020B78E6E|nr:hypothetical protein [Pseudomonas sp. SBB6]MCP3750382.1 hypothetical protein [Pseudomonas sp. SBB6]